MKKIGLMLFMGLMTLNTIHAQFFRYVEDDKTLFSRSNRLGVFFSASGDYRLDGGLYTLETGLALNLGNGFIGIYGAAGDDVSSFDQFNDVEFLKIAHGGLWFGFSPWQDKLIHPYADFKVGVGEANVYFFDPFYGVDSNVLLALNGSIGVELNLTKWIRLNAYYGGRNIKPFFDPQFQPESLSGNVIGLGLKMGFFGRDRSKRWHASSHSNTY